MTQQSIIITHVDGVTRVKARVHISPLGVVTLSYFHAEKWEKLTPADRARGKRRAGCTYSITLSEEQAKALNINI